jgi:hypothetical protein
MTDLHLTSSWYNVDRHREQSLMTSVLTKRPWHRNQSVVLILPTAVLVPVAPYIGYIASQIPSVAKQPKLSTCLAIPPNDFLPLDYDADLRL